MSAVYKGSVNSGFFDLIIEDSEGQQQWFEDSKSVQRTYDENGGHTETGILNFTNETYQSKWKFRPDPPLKAGRGKAILGMFEERDYVDKNGKTINHRPTLDVEEKDIILY